MKFSNDSTNDAVLEELGQRLARYRLNRNLTQSDLAREAGVSRRTLIRIEHGEAASTAHVIRLLRALGLLANLEALVPTPLVSPLQQVRMQGKSRRRASSPNESADGTEPWTWGDEE